MLIKSFLQEVSQCTLQCSTEIKISGFMDFQMHPHWMWMWDVDVLKFSGFMDPQMQPLPHVGTLCIETLRNHYHKKPLP